MKSKLALLLATLLFFNIILPVRVHAAVIPDISQVTAVWDSNIDTSWDHVYLEYKSLDPQSRYEADKVIAANAYRFLISIGSKPLEVLNQQKFDDFLRAVSPFNIAYNNVLAEQVVHAAWTISGEQYKVFCANVIHNIASNPDYYNTHVIKNDSFVNGAGQQSLQVQYNDVDINQELNIYNNIFNGNILSSTSSAVTFWFNPTPDNYNGNPFSLSQLLDYMPLVSGFSDSFNVFSVGYISSNKNEVSNYLWATSKGDSSLYYSDAGKYICFYVTIDSNLDATIRGGDYFLSTYGSLRTYLLGISDPNNPSVRYIGNHIPRTNVPVVPFNYSGFDSIKLACYQYFYDYFAPYLVYSRGLKVYVSNDYSSQYNYYDIPFPSGYTWFSPQFQPVNIYNNNYYGSDDDTYYYVDQMVDNIINNDYSTVNNGSNNTFYNDNYYITQPASGGGIELVTSSSIVYNYITIINNGGDNTSGGSIGSYPYPFDVRIINPEDIKNETETNTQNQIINNYDFDINAGDLTSTITTVKNTAVNNLNEVAPSSGSSIGWVKNMFLVIPSDLMKILLTFLIVGIIVCVYHSR